jgi:putative toxin-antitoxin system antitoxin component (TIGR02293 family)
VSDFLIKTENVCQIAVIFTSNGKDMNAESHKSSFMLLTFDDPFLLIEKTRGGLTKNDADELAEVYGLNDREMARILNLSERTYHRYKEEARLDVSASDRLLQLKKLLQYGEKVFEEREKFKRWMRRPLRTMYGEAPLALLNTITGMKIVETALGRIEHSVYI